MGTSKNDHRSSGTPDLPTNDSVLFSVRFCAVHPKDAGDFRPLQLFEFPIYEAILENAAVRHCRSPYFSYRERFHRQGTSLQLKNLIRPRHFDASVGKNCRELPHGAFLAVNKERAIRTGLLLPSQQLRLIGMAGEAIDGVNTGLNGNILAKNIYLLGAVDDNARKRPNGCIADEDDTRLFAAEVVLEVVANTAAGTHARPGHDDGSALDAVYRNGFGSLPRQM
jgi:hypothetical protein